MSKVNILTPVGRLVMGSLYKPSTKDADGNPLVYKSGANAGQPRVQYYLHLAVPKDGRDWKQTEWGSAIHSVAASAFPQAHKSPSFAFKVVDGDDTTPDMKGKRNVDREGFPGNWILKFGGTYAPKAYREDNGAYVLVTEPDFIVPGYYVQISGTVDGNGSNTKPGLYLNPSMVAFAAFGPKITFGPDANSVGFGKSPLPAGAMQTPPASSAPLPPSDVPAPPPPASAGERQMTAKAKGSSYQAFRTAGWTDENLIAQGFMLA